MPEVAEAQYRTVISKRCGHCGRTVPNSSKVGDRCPYCGVVWGMESSTYVNTPATTSSSLTSSGHASPIPMMFSFTLADYSSGYIADNLTPYYEARPNMMIGGEVGFGAGYQQTFFVVARYRQFTHEALMSRYDWDQFFVECGARYFGIDPVATIVQPFLGGGIGYTKVSIDDKSSIDPNGFGLYLEGGLEIRFSKAVSLSAVAEYCTYRLVYKEDYGYYDEIELLGIDSKLYLKASATLSFNRPR